MCLFIYLDNIKANYLILQNKITFCLIYLMFYILEKKVKKTNYIK